MINASSIVEELEERGIKLEVAEGKLRFHPRSALTEAEVARLREFKSLLVEFLLRGPEGEPAEVPPAPPPPTKEPTTNLSEVLERRKERPRLSERTIDHILRACESKFGSGKIVTGTKFSKAWLDSARLNIACVNPIKHRKAWRSTFGEHLNCADCSPPFSNDVVAERIDLDELSKGTPE